PAGARNLYLHEFEEMVGTPAYLNSVQVYPLLQGVRTNLYKCFIERGWTLGGQSGFLGLFHQTGLFDDRRGGRIRADLSVRAGWVVRLQNKLHLFEAVPSTRTSTFPIAPTTPPQVARVRQLSNLQHPSTLDLSL